MMAGIGGSFTASYNPNLQTQTSLNLPDMGGYGGGTDDWFNKLLALRNKQKRESQIAALGVAPESRGPEVDPIRRFWTVKTDLDQIQNQDPWAGRAYGQAQGLSMFNMPAASALTYGKDIFPNGFDTYAQILGASGGVNPAQQAVLGKNQNWGLGY
jgi:hypothetical protein